MQTTDDSIVNQGAIDLTEVVLYLNPYGYSNTSFTNAGSLMIDDAFDVYEASFPYEGSITPLYSWGAAA